MSWRSHCCGYCSGKKQGSDPGQRRVVLILLLVLDTFSWLAVQVSKQVCISFHLNQFGVSETPNQHCGAVLCLCLLKFRNVSIKRVVHFQNENFLIKYSPHVIQDAYDFLSSVEKKLRFLRKTFQDFPPHSGLQWWPVG